MTAACRVRFAEHAMPAVLRNWLVMRVASRPYRSSRSPGDGDAVRTERLETPVVEDEKLDAAKRPHEAGIAAIAFAERQIAEQPGNALVEHGAIVGAATLSRGPQRPRDLKGSIPGAPATLPFAQKRVRLRHSRGSCGPATTFCSPPHQRHRAEWTNTHVPTVWLAVHCGPNLC